MNDPMPNGETNAWIGITIDGNRLDGPETAIAQINEVIQERIDNTGVLVEEFDDATKRVADLMLFNPGGIAQVLSALSNPRINIVMEQD